ncbi:MAG: ABC transporter ATP-binding protein [Actinomycetia bacterium]|nr:ABC transporter ATP-binding protein [Actinomycetes bacterium]
MAEMLRIDNVTQAYGGLTVLHGISFTVAVGEKVGLIGPNGAGKTTALNVISGLLPSVSGRVCLAGQDITKLPVHRRIALGMGRSFQITSLFPELSILHNVLLALLGVQKSSYHMLRSITSFKPVNAAAKELLDSIDLWQARDCLPSEISYGQQRRLELTLALASRPKVLLLDEPSAGLSTEESAGLGKMLRLPTYENVAILLVAHDMDLVFGVADRILVLYYGTIFAEGTAEQIQRNDKVREIYFGSEAYRA